VRRLASTAAERIAAGAMDDVGVERLAADLGVSARHLRRVVERELGVSPVELAQTRRLLTAKRLLTDSPLPVTQVAFASGFGSLRRLNALFRERYRLSPAALRRAVRTPARRRDRTEPALTLSLAYRPPYDWPAMVGWLAPRATPGVEVVADACYRRAVRIGEHRGVVSVRVEPKAPALQVELSASLVPAMVPLLTRLRRLFDLDADPAVVREHLGADAWLAGLVRRRPGLRVAGAMVGFELALRAVLGQQASGITAAELRRRAEVWRPWRSYAAAHLWQSLADGTNDETIR
jgi:AraC family transcriptional regulator of adaptative response / DNA-3-methyladenine glycosylase II